MTVHEIDVRLGSDNLARPPIHDRLDDLDRMGRDMLAGLGWRNVPEPGGMLEQLDAPHAEYLNWACGPEGYASQAGMWFNPPVPVHHGAGAVQPLLVNERILEQPFVFGALAGMAPGSRILDVGGSESTVGLSLAALGHDVTIVDPRSHPLMHPNLHHVASRFDELPVAAGRFDAAIALSAVEHFGLEHYGLDARDERLDLAALAALLEHVRPGGLLVLTLPFGVSGVDSFQRVYDERGLAELLAGWDVETSLRAGRLDRLTWQLGVVPTRQQHGVALVTARRP